MGFPSGASGKNPPANAGDIRDTGSIPGSGRSPGGGNGHPLSSILGWRIPWTEDPGGLRSTGSQRVGNQWPSRQQEWYETSCYVFSNYLCLLFRARLFNSQFFKLGYLSFFFFFGCLTVCKILGPPPGIHLPWKDVVLSTGLPGTSWATGILPAERTHL